jgi:hypothetical protein
MTTKNDFPIRRLLKVIPEPVHIAINAGARITLGMPRQGNGLRTTEVQSLTQPGFPAASGTRDED